MFLILIWNAFFISAQETYEDKLGAWYMFNADNTISNKINISTGIQLWTYEPAENFNLLLLYTCLNYNVDTHWVASLGYGRVNWDTVFGATEDPNISENRMYEQISLKNKIHKFSLQNRLRLEHRFIDDGHSNFIKNRVRYCFKIKYPLNKTFFLAAYDELILNTNNDLFQQNRLYGALGVKASKNCSFQLGYLKNDFTTKSLSRLQIGLYINTDFRHI